MPRFLGPVPHADFNVDALVAAKERLGTSVSVCLPARNEVATVGPIVESIHRDLVGCLVDEIVVIDDGSTDATASTARTAGALVVAQSAILPEIGPGSGKGNALWKSLYACEGDLICWLDADVRNFSSHYVVGLLGPLLQDADVAFVKGCYSRPLHDDPTGGGRVTELMARPVISLLFPNLSRLAQPLAGEYAARREVVDAVPFVEGWGVELGLLVDVAARFGVGSIAQVDLGVREHRNRPLHELRPQATEILATALHKSGLGGAAVALRERPPMLTIPAYRSKFGRELSA